MIRGNAWIAAHPGSSDIRFRAVARDGEVAPFEAHRAVVVAHRGESNEVSLGGSVPEDGCLRRVAGSGGLDITAFVRRTDLLQATGRVRSLSFPDGSRLTLAAGVPVAEDRVVELEHAQIRASVPLEGIARSFRSEPLEEEEAFTYECSVTTPRDGVFALGDRLQLHLGDPPSFVECEASDAGYFVTFASPACFVARVPISADRVSPSEESMGMLGTTGHGGGCSFVREDAPLEWPDGSRAGATARRVFLSDDQRLEVEGRTCIRTVMGSQGPEEERTIVLCLQDPADLERSTHPPCLQRNSVALRSLESRTRRSESRSCRTVIETRSLAGFARKEPTAIPMNNIEKTFVD